MVVKENNGLLEADLLPASESEPSCQQVFSWSPCPIAFLPGRGSAPLAF